MHVVLALILVNAVLLLDLYSDIYEYVFGYILHVLDVNVYLGIYLHVLDKFTSQICVFHECTGRMCNLLNVQ